jgi:predicted transcriptional regulator
VRREKRTVYLMPDLAQRVDETAAMGGVSPSAVMETALDEHFARESMYAAVEALTRRVGELDDRIANQGATLSKLEQAINLLGKAVVGIRDTLRSPALAQPAQVEQPVPQDRGPEPAGRSGGGLLSGWR